MQVKRDEIVGKAMIITSYEEFPSKYKGKYAVVHAELEGKEIEFIANNYMLNQLKEVQLPIVAKVMKRDKGPYFQFVTPMV